MVASNTALVIWLNLNVSERWIKSKRCHSL